MPAFVATLLPLAGCAAMMIACSRMMRRGTCTPGPPTESSEISQLRAEIAELTIRIDQPAEQITAPLGVD